MKKLTISHRIILLSTILMILSGVITYVSLEGINAITSKYQWILDNNTTKQQITQDMFLQFREARINALLSVTEGATDETKKASLQAMNKASKEVDKLITLYENLKMVPEEQKIFKSIRENWQNYLVILEKIRTYHSENLDDKDLLFQIVQKDCPAAADKLKMSFENLVEYHAINTKNSIEEAVQTSLNTRNFTLFLAFASIFFGLVVTFFINRVTKNVLGSIVGKVTDVTYKLNTASENLAASSQQLATSAQQQASSTEEISSSLEEITGMVEATMKQSNDSVNLSKEISVLVEEGTESMENLEKSVAEIAETNKKVEKLVYLIEEIGKKTEIIDEIVFQTKLLSFNASVEAERAGEHGRGFAVVAQEVGNLAQMSGKSANEIGEIVKNSIKEAEEVVSLSKSKVASGVEFSKQTSTKLKSIHSVSKEISNAVNEVLKASEEQNIGIKQINTNVQLISHSTQENAATAEEFSSGSRMLTDQSKKLEKSVEDLQELVTGRVNKMERDYQIHDVADVVQFPKRNHKTSRPSPAKKAVGQNFQNEEEDFWDNL